MVKFLRSSRLAFGFLSALFCFSAAFALNPQLETGSEPVFAPIPEEVSSNHFTVTVGDRHSPVMHAASGYYLLNFEVNGGVRIKITADDPHYWDAGVEIQPMRLGIRPHREEASIDFLLEGPEKLCITRPNDHFADSEMLFLFANKPDRSGITAETAGIRYYGPGVHRENIDAKSGDHIYLAAGAVIFGALNLWQVHDVHVDGLGAIIYDGPQDPSHDEGWMHKPNWHVIVMDNASQIDIEGITGIVRSRTWMVQMRDSKGIVFRNVKIIGGNTGNANQDGMDWLGGGDTLVQDSFFRASDDIFAMYGNWDGYGDEALTAPGHEVSNITIENSVLSTSISNVVRLGWPRKVFDSRNFTLRNSDVLHMGLGGCGVPFALFELWADPHGEGQHSQIRLEDLRLDDLYSLTQIRQSKPAIRDITLANISLMDGPAMVPSVLKGDVSEVEFNGVNLGSGDALRNSELPVEIEDGAKEPRYEHSTLDASFTYSAGLLRPGVLVKFSANAKPGIRYRWAFGDGEAAEGNTVHHSFADAQGTLLDGSGRFRVLLSAKDDKGHESWSSQSIVVSKSSQPAARLDKTKDLSAGLIPRVPGTKNYDGYVQVPADGGYTFSLLTSTTASLTIDGVRAESPKPRPQVCGSRGNAVQAIRLSTSLSRGLHRIAIQRAQEIENATRMDNASELPLLLWEGPGILRQAVPNSAMFHPGKRGRPQRIEAASRDTAE
jgi:hypothetical protein